MPTGGSSARMTDRPWLGGVQRLQISLDAARAKLADIERNTRSG